MAGVAPGQVNVDPHKLVNVEAGAIVRHNDTYYLMVGSETEMLICTSKSPVGPFTLMKKNGKLFSRLQTEKGKTGHIHSYFSRFFRDDHHLLVNFHVLPRELDKTGRCSYTYMAPLKKVRFDAEGILRMDWWEGNVILIDEVTDKSTELWTADISYRCDTDLLFVCAEGKNFLFRLNQQGAGCLWDADGVEMEVDRSMALDKNCTLRVLVRSEFLEIYADGEYVCSYTAKGGIDTVFCDENTITKRMLLLP